MPAIRSLAVPSSRTLGLALGVTAALSLTAGPTLDEAEACRVGYSERLSLELGNSGEVPADAEGISFYSYSFRGAFEPKEVEVLLYEKGKVTNKRVPFEIRNDDVSGRYFLAFKRALKPGEEFIVRYHDSSRQVRVSNKKFSAPAALSMDIKMNHEGRASILTNAQDDDFRPMWRYRYFIDGEATSQHATASHYVAVCNNDARPSTGWHELAVEVWPGHRDDMLRMVTRDVWVDCDLADEHVHPSVTKAPNEHFVPHFASVD